MASLEDYVASVQTAVGNDILFALVILALGILLSRLVHFILQNKIKKLVEKTKTDLDDIVVGVLERPLEDAIVLATVYLAILSIQAFAPYREILANVFFVIAVFLVAHTIARLVSFFIPRWIHVVHKQHEKSPQLISRVLNAIVYLMAFLIVLDHFQVEITPIIAALGVGGLAVGLALQDSLGNFFAGVYIVSGSPIRVGDFIELPADNIRGYVEDISWRATKIRTLLNMLVIVPNSKLSQSIVVNTYLPDKEIAVLVPCGVSYSSNLEKVEKTTVDVAKKIQQTVPGAVKNFQPFIRYNQFGDSNINFTVILHGDEFTTQFLITHEFIKALKARFDKEGIEISFPVRKIEYAKLSKLKRS